jgi:hypothetical protein
VVVPVVPCFASVKVVPVIVEAFIASEKVAVTLVVASAAVAPSVGATLVTVGALEPIPK